MKFTITQDALKEAIAAVQGAVEKKGTLHILQYVVLEAAGSELCLSASDMDISIQKTVPAIVEQEGSVCVPSQKLFGIAQTLSADTDVSFTLDDKYWVIVKGGKAKFRVAGRSRDQFPEIHQPTDASVTLNSTLLKTLVERVQFSVFTGMTNERPGLMGAKLTVRDGIVRMVGADGYRLSLATAIAEVGPIDILLPRKALQQILHIPDDVAVEIGVEQSRVFFVTEGQKISARRLSAAYPNYELILPKDHDKSAVVDREALRDAVRRARLMIDTNLRKLRLTFSSGQVAVRAVSAEEGEIDDVVEAEYEGEEVPIAFQWDFVNDFFSACDAEKIRITFQSSSKITEFNAVGDEDWRYLITPQKL
jgi:DNA polymerase-3 subunit beta